MLFFVRPADRLLGDSESVLQTFPRQRDETKPPHVKLKPQMERDWKLATKICAVFLRHVAQCVFYFPRNALCFIIVSFTVQIILTYFIKLAL